MPLANRDSEALELLGPAPAPVSRLRDRFRWQLFLLGEREDLRSVARELVLQSRERVRGVTLRVDPNPIQML